MRVRDLMTDEVATCTPNTSLREVARAMVDCDCGMIPVVEGNGRRRAIGTVTDRDMVVRAVAHGKNPLDLSAGDIMSEAPVAIDRDASDDEAEELMATHQIRRLVVTDARGDCVGVLAQADIARSEPEDETGRVVKEVSRPSGRRRS